MEFKGSDVLRPRLEMTKPVYFHVDRDDILETINASSPW